MSCVCVHLPAIGVYAMWLDALLPLQFPCNTGNRDCNQQHTVKYVFVSICICWGVCASFLTLDVYLLHLVDLCDSLSELLSKFPELFSARGAETYQLFLLGGKRAQHGDAMGVV